MYESYGHAAFSNAAGNALDRVVANVTYTEEARKICFQQKWSTICRPTWLVAHLAPRADIAVFALELRWQPMGYCIGADHDKQCIRIVFSFRSAANINAGSRHRKGRCIANFHEEI